LLRRWTRRGLIVRTRRGTYAMGTLARAATDPARKHAFRAASVITATKRGWVASHHSAAILHGLDLLGHPPGKLIAVTTANRGSGNSSTYKGVQVHVARVPAGHVGVWSGVPCTSVARTVVDLARRSPFIDGVVVADSALHKGKTTKDELGGMLMQCVGWPGILTARRVVEFSDGRSESVLESAARVIFHERGLPAPDLQVWVGGEMDPRIGRVDFLWPNHRTIAEADGKAKYKDPRYKDPAVRQLQRDTRLRDAGFEVVHFTWAEIFYETDRVIARILTAFNRAKTLG
jgi:hypothetical protein